jgi:branched-chain amino acid transport system substrate-binding protein
MDFIKTYRSRAAAAGVDPLGVFIPPFSYARMQVLEQAVNGAGTLDDDKLADY